MGWSYKFVDLTDAQKANRRILLDEYGLIAQASAGVVLIVIQFFYLVQWLIQRQNQGELGPPSSPNLKLSQKGGHITTRRIQYWWRRLSWWAGHPFNILGIYAGTRGQFIAAAAWNVWLLFLCFAETENGKWSPRLLVFARN